MNITVTVQIGNSDNKLSQEDWAKFCNRIYQVILAWKEEIFFSAPSVGWSDWQNACFVFSINMDNKRYLRSELEEIRKAFLQDSVAWTEGATEFI